MILPPQKNFLPKNAGFPLNSAMNAMQHNLIGSKLDKLVCSWTKIENKAAIVKKNKQKTYKTT